MRVGPAAEDTSLPAVPAAALDGCVFTAELGLDRSLRPVRGVLPALLAARHAGYTRAVVATGNAAEAVMVAGLAVVPCPDLRTVLARLRGDPFPRQPDICAAGNPAAPGVPPGANLPVPPCVRQALKATAAGGHHLCLTGPHGARIPALAASAAALMPPLSPEQVMEVTAIHSAAGLLGPGHALITCPPFRAPHHNAARAAILGGGTAAILPGDAALAHCGVLFLHDAPEFPRDILASLRQPLQHARSPSPGLAGRSGSRRSSPLSPARPVPVPRRHGLLVQRSAGLPLPCPAGRRTRQPHRDLPQHRPVGSRHGWRRARSPERGRHLRGTCRRRP